MLDVVNDIRDFCGINYSANSINISNSNYLRTQTKKRRQRMRPNAHPYKDEPSIILVQHLTPKEVKQQKGFIDLSYLLSYVTVVCGNDIDTITTTCSKLTWSEKWILYFE